MDGQQQSVKILDGVLEKGMNQGSKQVGSYTGRKVSRKTHWSVHLGDFISKWLITVGGIGAIVAVSVVMVFLAWVAAPLFLSAQVTPSGTNEIPWQREDKTLLHFGVDDYQMMGWALFSDGEVDVMRVDTGELLSQNHLYENKTITAVSIIPGVETVVLGFESGEASIGSVKYQLEFMNKEDMPETYWTLADGESQKYQDGIVTRIPNGQFRYQQFSVEFAAPTKVSQSAIQYLNHAVAPSGLSFVAMTADGSLTLNQVREQTNFLTGETVYKATGNQLNYQAPYGAGPPIAVKTTGMGDNVYVIWRGGLLQRYDTRNPKETVLAETVDLVSEEPETITALEFLIGQKTLLVGDSSGRISAWFRVIQPEANTTDNNALVKAHEFHAVHSPVTTLAASQRGRSFAAGYENGHIRLMHVTSGKIMADVIVPGETPVSLITMAGKDDGLLAFSAGSIVRWAVDPRYPEATVQAIFGNVWYEGYAEPMHVWQSSSGTDDFEPKYGLIPLIFGSVKATFYSMLFALPIALLAAIYTSEFLHPRTKALFKPTIELMASLPSVVLGFMAALVFASWVEEYVPAVLSLFITIPISIIFSAYLFQLLPEPMYLRLLKFRFIFILLVMPIGFFAAFWIGPLAERLFFAGDIMLWLDGQIGNGTGGWMFLMLPLCGIGVLYCFSRWVNPWMRVHSAGWSRSKMARFDLIRSLCACGAAFGAAWAVSGMLTMIGWDPRGAYIDTYVQRNAMIVGFVMGFAVIPIIYTIAEDALSSVPSHLRSASLGCGATQWQTAVYVIIPTAMSGLFSAIMIGLGRAVGETMIVLMAAGNTPVLDWNMFNGFRTLSANIAVELPEAVRDSTHYRMLFLAALSLFVMTFVLNTLAEMIRLRFRKRTHEL